MLGKTYKDSVTGFEGVCIGMTDWITGCRQFTLSGKSIDNKPADIQYFDEDRLTPTEVDPITVPVRTKKGGGVPPTQRTGPSR